MSNTNKLIWAAIFAATAAYLWKKQKDNKARVMLVSA